MDEVGQGEAEMAIKQLEILRGFPLLELNESVLDLAAQFLTRSNLPPSASDDAVQLPETLRKIGLIDPDNMYYWVEGVTALTISAFI